MTGAQPSGIELSVVVPAFEEEGRLGPTLERIRAYLHGSGRRFEVIVVDDGSGDATADLVRAHGRDDDRIGLVELGVNRGKGAAVRAGVAASRGSRVLVSDADLSTPIEELGKLELALDEGADIAIGSRAAAGADVRIRQSRLRRTMGRVFNRLVRLLAGTPYLDTQCGFKLFEAEAARELFRRSTVDRFAFDVEVLELARRSGYRVAEVPVIWRHMEESRVSLLGDASRMLLDLVRLAVRLRRVGPYRGSDGR